MAIPKDTLDAFAEIQNALDDERENGHAGITVNKDAFEKIAVYIGTTARIRMKVASRNVRFLMQHNPEDIIRIQIESPKEFEAFVKEVEDSQPETVEQKTAA